MLNHVSTEARTSGVNSSHDAVIRRALRIAMPLTEDAEKEKAAEASPQRLLLFLNS